MKINIETQNTFKCVRCQVMVFYKFYDSASSDPSSKVRVCPICGEMKDVMKVQERSTSPSASPSTSISASPSESPSSSASSSPFDQKIMKVFDLREGWTEEQKETLQERFDQKMREACIGLKTKLDLRIQGKEQMCSARLDSNDYRQADCKYFTHSKNRDACVYDCFEFMCSKLIDKETGEDIN